MVVCPQMEALWQRHGLVLQNPPELAVVGVLALQLADVPREGVACDGIIIADRAVRHRHPRTGVALSQGPK